MAVLQQPVVSGNVFAEVIGDDLAPAGTYAAMVIDIRDEFGVTRQKFQSTEMETVDLTCFLFGFRDQQGYEHRVSSRRMKISGNEKSALFSFLKSLLGRAPQYGWDYMAVKGTQCLLTVEHVTKRDGTGVFAAIAALSPVPAGFAGVAGPAVGQSGGQPFGGAQNGAVGPRPMAAPAAVGQFGGRTGGLAPTAGPSPAPLRPMASAAMPGRPAQAARPLAQAPVAAEDPLPF